MNRQTNSTAADASQPSAGGSGSIGGASAARAFSMAGAVVGAGRGAVSTEPARPTPHAPPALPPGDVAILRFLAAAELVEADLWTQYRELAMGNAPYADALGRLDRDMVQYVNDNADDERSHAEFVNAYLTSAGAQPVNLDPFRTLPSSTAKGAARAGRLTNLTALTVDTSWWLRYRSPGNPDFGDRFPQLIDIVQQPAIPLHDHYSKDEIQAIANTAAFHFAAIEQGGSSLYTALLPKASHLDVVRILAAIGGTEVNHFAVWHDKVGNAPAVGVGRLVFPDPGTFDGDESKQANLVMPEPCKFLQADLPACSVIRPASTGNAGAIAAATALTNSGLFAGQSQAFFDALSAMAADADKAMRG
jgi:Ferritin-like domain